MNQNGINILSLFDGMSGGQIALDRLGIKVSNYFASEIDKYAIIVTQRNYPDTIELGDVTKIKGSDLPKIDLLIGGSPCQGFSFAGKQLNFDDPRSKLFFEFVRLLKEIKPKYFLLENVKMKKEYQDVISKYLGVSPVEINSALVSAQNRKRLYWTNIGATKDLLGNLVNGIRQPKDKGIVLRDIIEDGEALKSKSQTIVGTIYKENTKSVVERGKQGLLVLGGAIRGRYTNGETKQRLELRGDEKSNCLTTVQKDNVIVRSCELRDFNENSICHHAANATDINGNEHIKRVYADSGKSPALTTMQGGHREPKILLNETNINFMNRVWGKDTRWIKHKNPIGGKSGCVVATMSKGLPRGVICTDEELQEKIYKNGVCDLEDFRNNKAMYRKLTPIECERLQTVPDNYTAGVSNTQRYKMLGNGFTVDVIAHILKGMFNE